MDNLSPRRERLHLSPLSTTEMHVRHPLMTMWWAASFGGFGQLIMSNHIKGYLLIILEIIFNLQAHLNLSILYSFTGRYELAKEVLDIRWALAYALAYIYGLWDAYNHTITINKQATLALREKAPMKVFKLHPASVNFLDKRSPWLSVFWSLVLPGLGHMYIMRMVTGYFLIAFSLICIYYARFFQVLQCTLLGNFSQAAAITDAQWFLFLPSIYGYAAYEAYASTIALNKAFVNEQRDFFKQHYQSLQIQLPLPHSKGETGMLIAATFNHSSFVELAITELNENGISKAKVMAIPLLQKEKDFVILDTIHTADGFSNVDYAAVFGTIGMVLGVIYGFVWYWGPIIWGLLGLTAGGAAGFTLGYLQNRRTSSLQEKDRQRKGNVSELVLLISCDQQQSEMVEKILRNNTAFGIGKVVA